MMMIMISYIIDLIKLLLHMIIMDKLTSLRAERRRREVRREKFTHVNCTLPTIHLAPGPGPGPSDDDDDGGDGAFR